MGTQVYFNGKMRSLPGAYSTITSGESSASRNLDYATVLLLDTGVYGSGFGGGAGINGTGASGKDAVYEFQDLASFRNFVKGGMYYKCAEALFNPDPFNNDAVGISRLLFVRACTTSPANMNFNALGGGQNGGKVVFATIDEGINANANIEGNRLKSGYAFSVQAGYDDPEAFIVSFWRGTYTGLYKDPVTGVELSYDELTIEEAEPELICLTPELHNVSELIEWCNQDENFGARFRLETFNVIGDGTVDADDIASMSNLQAATGAVEQYKPTDIDDALQYIADIDYNIIMTDQVGNSANSSINKKVIAHRNSDSLFDKFVYIGAHDSKLKFNESIALSKEFNSSWIVCVHGGVGVASDEVSSKVRWWGVFYNLCQIVGRVSGKPPYIPVTNKTVGGDKLQHIPDEKEREKAIKFGLVVVYPNPYLVRNVVLQGVTTIQDNKTLFNRKGHSFSIQFMRIIAQLNKEAVVNAEIDLLADENGVNLSTLSKGSLETWTINFLTSRLAVENQDNLIIRFQNVVAKRIEDYYSVTYEVVINNEVTKLFFTGFLLKE